MANWRKSVAVSDRWQLTVRLAAYITLGLLLNAVVRIITETLKGTRPVTAIGRNLISAGAKATPQFTSEQLILKDHLEKQLSATRPTHRLTLRDGRMIDCQVVARTETTVRVRESFGLSGQITASYPRAEVQTIAPLPAEMFAVTLADVELYQEFPTFKFAKFPPYTFVTDESVGTIDRLLQLLLTLRLQFLKHFAPLIREPDCSPNIQVVFFSQQTRFKDYAKDVAPTYVNSAGFYSVENNRLTIFNQFGSSHYSKIQRQLARSQRQLELLPDADATVLSVTAQQLTDARTNLDRMAQAITSRSINHEGAHQLFYTYGIHSTAGAEPTWLKEGLAAYCEPAELGNYHPELARRVVQLRNEGKLLPLQTLLNFHKATGFAGLPQEGSEAAYAESWALVYFLMQPQTRETFFEFIRRYRDVDNATSAIQMRTADVDGGLASILGMDVSTLESRWQDFLSHLR